MDSLLPGSRLGRYEVLERIGRGGMASVFRAHDPELDRDVAIKVLPSYRAESPALVERFTQEAQALAGLCHSNIVQFHDFGEDKGFSYIAMEYVTDGTLQERLGRLLPLADVLELIGPLADALETAHGQGIVHRDIKPSNVLMEARRRLVGRPRAAVGPNADEYDRQEREPKHIVLRRDIPVV